MSPITPDNLVAVFTNMPKSKAEELRSIAYERGVCRPTLVREILLDWLANERWERAADEVTAEVMDALAQDAVEQNRAGNTRSIEEFISEAEATLHPDADGLEMEG